MSTPTPVAVSTQEPHPVRRWLLPVMGIGGLLVLGFVVRSCMSRSAKGDPRGGRAVTVMTAVVRSGDLDVTLTGLGTVVPMGAVTIKSRVDGQLMRVAFKEGQLVKQGDVLAEIDPRPFQVQLLQAEGQYAKNEAALKNARADLQRLDALVKQGIISRQQADTQSTVVNQLEAALKSDTAALESAKLNLTYARITAPVSGRVGLRLVEPGNMVRASDAAGLVVVTPVQPITVLFTVPADAIQQVLKQTAAGTMHVEAWDRDFTDKLATGTLTSVDNQVDVATGTVKLRASFTNENGALFPNQFVNVRLKLDTLQNVAILPSMALQRSPQGTFVYVVKADNTVDQRNVEIRATDGENTGIAKGLTVGETVVVDGMEKLRPGAKVQVPEAKPKEGPRGTK